jgi:NAD(P)-dependent dehydrogenase (short-subunit alcohol dehydrogenase family)
VGPGAKTVVITGGNAGIGKETAVGLAEQGFRVLITSRDPARGSAAVAEIRERSGSPSVDVVALDLADLASVRRCAAGLLAQTDRLDVLVTNAGLVVGRRTETADGFEMTFGVNHLGHFLLTTLLLDRLRASAPARIVHVASENHRHARGIDWEAVRRPTASVSGLPEYGVSKLANVLFSAELARRLQGTGIETCAVNPGRVASNIWQRLPWPIRPLFKLTMMSPAEGSLSTVKAATEPVESGAYYDRRGALQPASAPARDAALARELWERSAAWIAD